MVFDVGETLLDDTREWAAWASWLRVPPHTLSALVGAVTALGRDNADALRLVRPGLDVAQARQQREAEGSPEAYDEKDLYPDARPALTALRERGFWVGVAGNQTARAAEILRGFELPIDAMATSGEWGVAKPEPEFFAKVVEWSGFPAEEILYVGDHKQNDLAAARLGLRTALIRRGPWGYLWADDPDTRADYRIESLLDLVPLLASTS
ncbi:hypothetical protein GCM10027589_34020 [Actinocorallia lasiicapitis]